MGCGGGVLVRWGWVDVWGGMGDGGIHVDVCCFWVVSLRVGFLLLLSVLSVLLHTVKLQNKGTCNTQHAPIPLPLYHTPPAPLPSPPGV